MLFIYQKYFHHKLLNTHFQYVCYIPAKYQKDTLKALLGDDLKSIR